MSRHVVAYEGKPSIDGLFIEKGALRVNREPIPVTVAFDPMNIIGRATGFERDDETGAISFEIEFMNGMSEEGLSPSISASNTIGNITGDKRRVSEAVIREISFITGPKLWP